MSDSRHGCVCLLAEPVAAVPGKPLPNELPITGVTDDLRKSAS